MLVQLLTCGELQDLFGIGRDLADTDVDALSDDQKMQLERLRESTMRIGLDDRVEGDQKEGSRGSEQR